MTPKHAHLLGHSKAADFVPNICHGQSQTAFLLIVAHVSVVFLGLIAKWRRISLVLALVLLRGVAVHVFPPHYCFYPNPAVFVPCGWCSESNSAGKGKGKSKDKSKGKGKASSPKSGGGGGDSEAGSPGDSKGGEEEEDGKEDNDKESKDGDGGDDDDDDDDDDGLNVDDLDLSDDDQDLSLSDMEEVWFWVV